MCLSIRGGRVVFKGCGTSASFSTQRQLERRLEHQSICGRRRSEADSQMQREIVAEREVGRRKDLMPLARFPVRSVVLDSQHHGPAEREPGARARPAFSESARTLEVTPILERRFGAL